MELSSVDLSRLHGGGKAHAVVAPSLAKPSSGRHRIVRMHEIEVRSVPDAFEELQLPVVPNAVPAHVGHTIGARRKSAHDPRDHVEALALAKLLAAGEKQLVADADA